MQVSSCICCSVAQSRRCKVAELSNQGVAIDKSDRRVKGLGEASIRVKNLDAIHKFHEAVVRLEVLRQDESFVFYKIAEGEGGHTQNLALFEASNGGFLQDKSEQLNHEGSTLDHIALNVALEDFGSERICLEGLGLKVNETGYERLHVYSIYSATGGEFTGVCCYNETIR